jgi:hypothetical protein
VFSSASLGDPTHLLICHLHTLHGVLFFVFVAYSPISYL